jgi:hypothetical protein
VILYRCFAWDSRAKTAEPDGPLWFPRALQGDGRHDNPDVFGCLYLSEREISTVVEQLARFRSQRLIPSMLRRRGLPLAVATLVLGDTARVVDFDDPGVLSRLGLRPSRVATRDRSITQPQARVTHDANARADGLRWWSTYEGMWANLTLFDRAASKLSVSSVRALSTSDDVVMQAADFLGLRPPGR